jgi:nickel-dependent lactate racemase
MRECKTPERVEAVLRAKFEIGAHKAYAVTRLMKKAEFILVSAMDPEFSRMLLFTPAQTVEQALALAYQKLGPTPGITLMPMGALTVPLNATPVK